MRQDDRKKVESLSHHLKQVTKELDDFYEGCREDVSIFDIDAIICKIKNDLYKIGEGRYDEV